MYEIILCCLHLVSLAPHKFFCPRKKFCVKKSIFKKLKQHYCYSWFTFFIKAMNAAKNPVVKTIFNGRGICFVYILNVL